VATREHAPIVNLRWAAQTDARERSMLRHRYELARCAPSDERTDTCELLDTSRSNIAAIVSDDRIEDTYHIVRAGLTVSPDADRATHVTWIAHRTPLTRVRGSVEGLLLVAFALLASGPIARRRVRTRAEGRALVSVNVTLATLALALFAALSWASGQIDVEGGLGYDGRVYAAMLEEGLTAGTRFTLMRPLIILLARVPYYFTQDVIASFELLNYVFAFAQAYLIATLADLYGATRIGKVYLVVSLSVCIATAKMFAYYPVLVDLGGYVALLLAVYAVLAAPKPVAAVAVCAAVAAREFGIAVAFFGIVRSLRRREGTAAALAYVPAIAAFALLRYIGATRGVQGYSIFELLVQNLAHWQEFWYLAAFAYFLLTLFGGISLILAARPHDWAPLLIEEPEWVIFGGTILGITLVFGIDIWRYLAFGLPLAVVLFARASARWTARERIWLYTLAAFATWYTQRPFERVTLERYFRDWFPYYVAYLASSPFPPDILWPVWSWRFPVTGALFGALVLSNLARVRARQHAGTVAPISPI
jgi:hypothetical protein